MTGLWRAAAGAVALVLLLAGCATGGADPVGTEALHREAMQAYGAGRYAEAGAALERYLARRPEDAGAWYRLGNALARQDRLREAEAAYYRALDLEPGMARARHNLGLVHMQLAWKALFEARRALPEVDSAAAATMRYLGCLMETFMGHPEPELCREAPVEETFQ